MDVRTAALCYRYDDVWVQVTDVPLWAVLAERLTDVACQALGSRLCSPPEWSFRLRWGPEDEFGIADKSAGHKWWTLGQKLHGLSCKHEKEVARIPVTHDWVRANWPDHCLDDGVDSSADESV